MLSLGQHLALAAPWWSWDSRTIRKALWASVLARLYRLGNARMKANETAGRSPTDWSDLAFLRKEPKTHRRVFAGTTNLCAELLLGYASVLGIDTRDCFPETDAWIAEAAAHLCRYADGRVRPVEVADALVYAKCVVPIVRGGARTGPEIQESLARLPGDVQPVVAAVAGALAPVLEAIHRKLTNASERGSDDGNR